MGRPEISEIMEKALELLSYREHSEKELLDKLLVRRFSRESSLEVIGTLRRKGLLNDKQFAESFIRQRIRTKPLGTRALVQMLGAKGIPHQEAGPIVRKIFDEEGVEERDLARKVLQREFKGETPDVPSINRVRNLLVRRGFEASMIRVLLDELVETISGPEVEYDVDEF